MVATTGGYRGILAAAAGLLRWVGACCGSGAVPAADRSERGEMTEFRLPEAPAERYPSVSVALVTIESKMTVGTIFPPLLASLGLLIPLLSMREPAAAQELMSICLVDVAEDAGVHLLNICGERTKEYIVEVNGNGAAFFDYDDDGDLDLLLINGSTLENLKSGGDPVAALYVNNGHGSFSDHTGPSGLSNNGWGMGACVADYDNDGFEDVHVTSYGNNVLLRNNGDGWARLSRG